MDTLSTSDLDTPFDLAEHLRPFAFSENEQAWMEGRKQDAREIATIFGIPPLLFDVSAVDMEKLKEDLSTAPYPRTIFTDHTEPSWILSPKTYESLKFLANFREPLRKLRKCQLRRIAHRKQQYRQHRARVNAAMQERIRSR